MSKGFAPVCMFCTRPVKKSLVRRYSLSVHTPQDPNHYGHHAAWLCEGCFIQLEQAAAKLRGEADAFEGG